MKEETFKLLEQVVKILTDEKHRVNEAEKLMNELLSFHDISGFEAEIYTNIGIIYMIQEKFGQAIHYFKVALDLTKNPEIRSLCFNNIGICDRKKSFIIDNDRIRNNAILAFKKSYKIKQNIDSLSNVGSMHVSSNESDEAIDLFTKVIEIDPDDANAHWNRSLAYLEKYDFKNGWQGYEYGKRTDVRHKRTYGDLPEWDGTNGSKIIIYGEQGIGDEIMWASIIPDIAKDNDIILDAHPRLQDLFRESFPQIKVYGTRKESQCYWPKYHNAQYHLAIGSLCKFYRNELDEFPKTPYLKANAEISQKYKDKLNSLSNRKKIGISWRGGTTDTGELFRRIELEKWVDLFKEDFDFISLQYKEDAEKDLKEFQDKYPEFKIHHWRDVIDDYDETAGLIDNLDLIISVPQSIIHLAGAMGVKTLQLTPYRHMWQMGKFGEDMPWYDSVKNIWQKEHGKWDDVMVQAKEQLCSL